jgi:putative redox protein
VKSEKITFNGSTGEKLSGRIDFPESEPKHFALFAHCFTCSKNLRAVGNITKALAVNGIATLRFDFTGLGESEGDFADTNFSSNVDDLIAASDYLNENFKAPALIIGHSLGGAAILQAASSLKKAKALVTIGSPCNPDHVMHHFEADMSEIEETGEALVILAGRSFKIKKQFLDDLEASNMNDAISKLNKALLVMHAPLDDTVSIDNAAHIFKMAKHPKSFVSLDGADHLLSDNNYSLYAGSVIAAWSSIYI